jgi:hypothetical protein
VRSDAPWRTIIERLPGGEIMHREVKGDTPPWALTRGPVVYAADTVWWSDPKVPSPARIGDDLAIVPDLQKVRQIEKPGHVAGPVYEAEFVGANGKPLRVPMVPFTNIGQWYRPGAPKPDKNAAAFSYAIWFLDPQSPIFQEKIHQADQLRQRFAGSVDYILIGDPASEAEHQASGGIIGTFKDRPYKHGSEFSYVLKVPAGKDGKLIVTYWGGDVNREFDLFADVQRIGNQKLQGQKPGEFFEQTYRIPFDLIRGRTDSFGRKVDSVTIRFKSRSQDVAGGVYGIRTE